MRVRGRRYEVATVFVVAVLFVVAPKVTAQTEVAKRDLTRRVARRIPAVDLDVAREHPLWPALELAVESYKHIRRDIRDYSCTLIRRERVGGSLQTRELMTAKVRHERRRDGRTVIPFGVYLKFRGPTKVKGREVLFVDGMHDGNMIVRNGGKRFAFVTTRLLPTSDTAMHGNRYPITEFGFENLVRRLMEVAKEDIAQGAATEVEFFRDAKVDGRSCTGIRVTHPNYDSDARFYSATIFMDNELRVPIHYEAYDWPDQESDEPRLLEQYTYRDIRLNVGYSDEDFDPANPGYQLR